jgi:RNA polymerase sigma factor (sigma-70 family)
VDTTTIQVRRAIEGQRDSLEWIVRRFYAFVRAQVVLRLGDAAQEQDIEDVVADVWTIAMRNLRDLRPRHGRLSPVLVRYLGMTALRQCNNFLRRRIRRRRKQARDSTDAGDRMDRLAAETADVVTRVAHRDLEDHVRECLDRMTPNGKSVLVLRLMEGLSNQEIAQTLEIAPNTAAVRYRRALKDLRKCLPAEVFSDVWISGRGR